MKRSMRRAKRIVGRGFFWIHNNHWGVEGELENSSDEGIFAFIWDISAPLLVVENSTTKGS